MKRISQIVFLSLCLLAIGSNFQTANAETKATQEFSCYAKDGTPINCTTGDVEEPKKKRKKR